MQKLMRFVFAAQLATTLFFVHDIWKMLRDGDDEDDDDPGGGGYEWPTPWQDPSGAVEWWYPSDIVPNVTFNDSTDRFSLRQDA